MFPLYPLAVSRATIASMYPIQLVILAVLALLLGTLLLWLAGLSWKRGFRARITHRSHERRAFHGLFRAWPAAAAATTCDHAASGAELTFETDYCIEIS
jgi:hypothetical protein